MGKDETLSYRSRARASHIYGTSGTSTIELASGWYIADASSGGVEDLNTNRARERYTGWSPAPIRQLLLGNFERRNAPGLILESRQHTHAGGFRTWKLFARVCVYMYHQGETWKLGQFPYARAAFLPDKGLRRKCLSVSTLFASNGIYGK